MDTGLAIRPALPDDVVAIADIYNHYVLQSTVTFEEQPVTVADMTARVAEVSAARLPWRVAIRDGHVLGYAYAGTWKGRCAYRYSVESTIYLEPGKSGRGIGTRLYKRSIRHAT